MPGEARVRNHPPQRAFELAYVRADPLADEERHFLRQDHAGVLRLGDQDGHTGLELRRLDRDRQAPTKTGLESFLEAVDLLRIAIARQDDLVLALEQFV